MPNDLIKYIQSHSERGECQCGRCADKGEDRTPTGHAVNVHFFWVQPRDNPTAAELRALLEAEYPRIDRLRDGPSYIEIGAEIGDQGLALQLIGLGALVGLWTAITPATMFFEGASADEMAGLGFVMCSGLPRASIAPSDDDLAQRPTSSQGDSNGV